MATLHALPIPATFNGRPTFTSASGRTVGFLDAAWVQQLAEEHEWLRDRVARLEYENAKLRTLIEAAPRPPVICTATA